MDIVFIGSIVTCLLVTIGLAAACDKLGGRQ